MAKKYYENKNGRAYSLSSSFLIKIIAILTIGYGFLYVSKKLIENQLSKMTQFHFLYDFIFQLNTIIWLTKLAIVIPLILILLFMGYKFFYLGNPHNRGKFTLRIKQYILYKQIEKGLIDEGIVNHRQKSDGFEVGRIYPEINANDIVIHIELVAGIKENIIKSFNAINASMMWLFNDYIVDSFKESANGRWIELHLKDTSRSYKLSPKNLDELMPEENYKLSISKNIQWDITKIPHALITGKTGSGKTYFLYSLIIQILQSGAELIIFDPKKSDLSMLREIIGVENVFINPTEMLFKTREIVSLMEEREQQLYALKKVEKDWQNGFEKYSKVIPPVYVIIDEYSALIESFPSKKEKDEFISNIKQLVLKSRSSGITLLFAMQRPDSKVISGDIRDQLGMRVQLGNTTSQSRLMVFGDGWEYEQTNFARGSGLILIDGICDSPTYFETPDLRQLGDDLFNVFEMAQQIGTVNNED